MVFYIAKQKAIGEERLRILRQLDVEAAVKMYGATGNYITPHAALASLHKVRVQKKMRKFFTQTQINASRIWLRVNGFTGQVG